jgi:amphi-Trp domain-containing protein
MKKKTKLLKSNERKSVTEVSDFLHLIAEKINSGQVVLRQGKEEAVLELPEMLTLKVQVKGKETKKKGMQHALTIGIRWFDNEITGKPLELG